MMKNMTHLILDINIEKYLEYVYEDTELAASFKKAVKKKVETSSDEVS